MKTPHSYSKDICDHVLYWFHAEKAQMPEKLRQASLKLRRYLPSYGLAQPVKPLRYKEKRDQYPRFKAGQRRLKFVNATRFHSRTQRLDCFPRLKQPIGSSEGTSCTDNRSSPKVRPIGRRILTIQFHDLAHVASEVAPCGLHHWSGASVYMKHRQFGAPTPRTITSVLSD